MMELGKPEWSALRDLKESKTMEKILPSLLLHFIFWLHLSIRPAHGYQFIIEGYKPHCFYETFVPGVDVKIEYVVAQGTGEAPAVNLIVKDKSGREKLNAEKVDHGTLTLTTETGTETERLSFCFNQVEAGKWHVVKYKNKPPTRKITLKVRAVMEVKKYPDLAKDKDLSVVEETIQKTEWRVNQLIRAVDASRGAAEHLVQLDERTSTIVIALGLLSSFVIVIGGVTQMYITTRKLTHEKSI